jgi:hypothetical protein
MICKLWICNWLTWIAEFDVSITKNNFNYLPSMCLSTNVIKRIASQIKNFFFPCLCLIWIKKFLHKKWFLFFLICHRQRKYKYCNYINVNTASVCVQVCNRKHEIKSIILSCLAHQRMIVFHFDLKCEKWKPNRELIMYHHRYYYM